MTDRPIRGRALAPFVQVSMGLHAVLGILCVMYPLHWPLFAGCILANHLMLVGASLWPRSRLLGANLRRLPPRWPAGSAVALTFDDGPDPEVTPAVLRILEQRVATATFFCIGERAERHRDLVREIVRRGHRVENHTYGHSNAFCFKGPGAMHRDVGRAQAILADASGSPPSYFRAPAGLRNPWLDRVIALYDLDLVSWTRRGFDTVSRDPSKILARLTRGLAAGDVLLLHDGSSARDAAGQPVVLSVLPRLLDELERRGLTAVSIPTAPPR